MTKYRIMTTAATRCGALGGAVALGPACLALAQGARDRTIHFVPSANLNLIAPMITTAGMSLDREFLVFDQL